MRLKYSALSSASVKPRDGSAATAIRPCTSLSSGTGTSSNSPASVNAFALTVWAAAWQAAFDRFSISYDRFIRTTDADHLPSTQELWRRMGTEMGYTVIKLENGDVLDLDEEEAEITEKVTSGVVIVGTRSTASLAHHLWFALEKIGIDATPQVQVEQRGEEHIGGQQGRTAQQRRSDDQPESQRPAVGQQSSA